MRKVNVFNFITLNGFYKGPNDDTSWHEHGKSEEGEFAAEGAKSKSTLLFGRKTYEMMASFWPTPFAMEAMPVVAQNINSRPKIVFSTTLKEPGWNNVKIINGNLTEHVRRMKTEAGEDMTILGSGSIVAQLAGQNLIDEYQLAIYPIALGRGKSPFQGLTTPLNLELATTRAFRNGNVLLSYRAIH